MAPSPQWRGHFLDCLGGLSVLGKLSIESAECYRLAEQAREWVEETTDPRIRQDYLSVERSWLLLAESYESSERLTHFTGNRNRKRA
jgi:hypothetical protein